MTTISFFLVGAFSIGPTEYVVLTILSVLVRMLIGGALAFGAPAVAARFYPIDSQGEDSRLSVGPGDIYRTACFVLGAYLLVATAQPAGLLLADAVRGGWRQTNLIANAITATVYFFSGSLLVFGSRRIAELLTNLQYDPDTIPSQRISLAMLLTFLVLIAAILVVTRQLSLRM